MAYRLIIDGNSVYEIDEECLGKSEKTEDRSRGQGENVIEVNGSGRKSV